MVTKWQQERYEKRENFTNCRPLVYWTAEWGKLFQKKDRPRRSFFVCTYASIPRLVRYFFTISATLKVMASSNSRRSNPVSFLIFSRR